MPQDIRWVVSGVAVDQLPVRRSRTPAKSVTNMHCALSRLSSSLTWVRMLPGDRSSVDRDRIKVFVTAMNRAAGTPLSETSPMHRNNRSSPTK